MFRSCTLRRIALFSEMILPLRARNKALRLEKEAANTYFAPFHQRTRLIASAPLHLALLRCQSERVFKPRRDEVFSLATTASVIDELLSRKRVASEPGVSAATPPTSASFSLPQRVVDPTSRTSPWRTSIDGGASEPSSSRPARRHACRGGMIACT